MRKPIKLGNFEVDSESCLSFASEEKFIKFYKDKCFYDKDDATRLELLKSVYSNAVKINEKSKAEIKPAKKM